MHYLLIICLLLLMTKPGLTLQVLFLLDLWIWLQHLMPTQMTFIHLQEACMSPKLSFNMVTELYPVHFCHLSMLLIPTCPWKMLWISWMLELLKGHILSLLPNTPGQWSVYTHKHEWALSSSQLCHIQCEGMLCYTKTDLIPLKPPSCASSDSLALCSEFPSTSLRTGEKRQIFINDFRHRLWRN